MPSKIPKEHFNEETIESAFQTIFAQNIENLIPHFIYTGGDYSYVVTNDLKSDFNESETIGNQLRSLLLKLMKKYQINTVMLTMIYMKKEKLIT